MMAEWRPIETCPQDTFCLVYQDGAIRTMLRENGAWLSLAVAIDKFGDVVPGVDVRETGVYEPTHWMPLPDPPLDNPS
jgi:hypothetical protein